MTNSIYKKLEFVGTSTTGVEDAVASAVTHAVQAGHLVDWFEIV